jgi:hypothetical protein
MIMTDDQGMKRRTFIGGGLAAMVLAAAGCRGSGDDDHGNPAPPTGATPDPDTTPDPTPEEEWTGNYNKVGDLTPFYTQETASISDTIGSYGVNIKDSPGLYSMTAAEFKDAYMNDATFNLAVNEMYRPVMQMLNPDWDNFEADEQVGNLVKSLTDNEGTDLVSGASVFFNYVSAGRGYFALSIKDEQGNKKVLVAVDNDAMAFDGITPITNVTDLVDMIMTNPDYGGM